VYECVYVYTEIRTTLETLCVYVMASWMLEERTGEEEVEGVSKISYLVFSSCQRVVLGVPFLLLRHL